MNKALVIGAVVASSIILVACQQPEANPAAVEQTPPVQTTPSAVTTPETQSSSSSASLSILPAAANGETQTGTSTATLSINPAEKSTTQNENVDAKLEIQPKTK